VTDGFVDRMRANVEQQINEYSRGLARARATGRVKRELAPPHSFVSQHTARGGNTEELRYKGWRRLRRRGWRQPEGDLVNEDARRELSCLVGYYAAHRFEGPLNYAFATSVVQVSVPGGQTIYAVALATKADSKERLKAVLARLLRASHTL